MIKMFVSIVKTLLNCLILIIAKDISNYTERGQAHV